MLVYQNKDANKVYYGDKRIRQVYLGDRLIFKDQFFWKYVLETSASSDLVYYNDKLLLCNNGETTVWKEDVNDAAYSGTIGLWLAARSTGLYDVTGGAETLFTEGNWNRVSYCRKWEYSAGNNEFPEYSEAVGILDGEAAAYLYSSIEYVKHLNKCGEKTRKLIGSFALTDSGSLLYADYIKEFYQGYTTLVGTEWKTNNTDVLDFCKYSDSRGLSLLENAVYLKKDGSVYTTNYSPVLVTTIDSDDVKFSENCFIVDGIIHAVTGTDFSPVLHQSNIGGFSDATSTVAIRDGVLYYASNLSNVTAIAGSPDNFVEISGPMGRTEDNRFFIASTTDGGITLTELDLENAQ